MPSIVEPTPGDVVDQLCVNNNVLRAFQNPARTAGSHPFRGSCIGLGLTSTRARTTV